MSDTYRWTGTHAYRDHRNGRVIEPGDTFEADRIASAHPYDCEPVEDKDEQETLGEDADGGGEAEGDDAAGIAEPPLDPADFAVDELRTALSDADYDAGELDAIEDAERAGKARSTAIEAIQGAR